MAGHVPADRVSHHKRINVGQSALVSHLNLASSGLFGRASQNDDSPGYPLTEHLLLSQKCRAHGTPRNQIMPAGMTKLWERVIFGAKCKCRRGSIAIGEFRPISCFQAAIRAGDRETLPAKKINLPLTSLTLFQTQLRIFPNPTRQGLDRLFFVDRKMVFLKDFLPFLFPQGHDTLSINVHVHCH